MSFLSLGCATHPTARDGNAPPTVTLQTPPAEPPPTYVLQEGDQLAVRFYFNKELDEDVVIRPDGMISLQLIGDIPAAGRTPEALAAHVTQRYTGELANPKVTVIVRQFGSRVYVSGEVSKAGVVGLTAGLTMFQAIQEAGGFLDTAHRSQCILVRRVQGSELEAYEVDMRAVQNGNDPSKDIPLKPYDIVFVPKSKIAELGVWVNQYFNNIMPRLPFGFAIF